MWVIPVTQQPYCISSVFSSADGSVFRQYRMLCTFPSQASSSPQLFLWIRLCFCPCQEGLSTKIIVIPLSDLSWQNLFPASKETPFRLSTVSGWDVSQHLSDSDWDSGSYLSLRLAVSISSIGAVLLPSYPQHLPLVSSLNRAPRPRLTSLCLSPPFLQSCSACWRRVPRRRWRRSSGTMPPCHATTSSRRPALSTSSGYCRNQTPNREWWVVSRWFQRVSRKLLVTVIKQAYCTAN